ncbi:MAG TPA: hypothetical protein DCZ61_03440, partial [Lachnospiraceae bacterium]|nr:hypothetical protein [Lachnospiraceae bacterium]
QSGQCGLEPGEAGGGLEDLPDIRGEGLKGCRTYAEQEGRAAGHMRGRMENLAERTGSRMEALLRCRKGFRRKNAWLRTLDAAIIKTPEVRGI